ncbi:ketosteroid isomerase-like protein [Microbacterium resistens]|uniref:Ketosteroid isomerase-like protein n=1 Tax=Microbacterium resistens TaxID=156977 RepID=A0ABU1SFG8_9MICO|nr:nuclear transport factor 2 family protein [Microbacterium resistens]MDR6867622.1 ketosteroid isomerase-like protein [Microbacterium resistens]
MSQPLTDPTQLPLAFAERFNARDLDGLVALSTSNAVFVPQPGVAVTGEGIRAALQQFLDLQLPITMTPRHTFASGTVGLVVADWSLEGTGPDGSAVALAGQTADVVVLDGDNGWKYAIDNPFGTA